jgi:2-haloacid dehalogenase
MKNYKVVLFDLLTALLDSWTLWNNVAGSEVKGIEWRKAYLKKTYNSGAYKPYTTLVAEAAVEVGMQAIKANELEARWLELRPWHDVPEVLQQLSKKVKLGVVTNCSNALGIAAASIIQVPFNTIITAEQAGYYKPCVQPYALALHALQVTTAETLFVAGSAYDIIGTSALGIDTYWHNKMNLTLPYNIPMPVMHERNLTPLLHLF